MAHGQDGPAARRVLILYEVGTTYPITNLADEGIRTALGSSPYRIEYYREYFETVLFPDPASQKQFRNYLIQKYKHHQPEVIIAVGPAPLQFLVESHKKYFPGVPVLFCIPNRSPGALQLDSDFTGVEGDTKPAATIQAALKLLPDTQRIVVIGGTSAFDRQQQAVIKRELKQFEGKIDISYLTELPMPALLERLKSLPPHSIGLMTPFSQDSAGTRFTSTEAGPEIVTASSAPIFSLTDRYIDHGEVGGSISSIGEEGRIVGQMALKILDGQKPQDIPPVKDASKYVFDLRALQRWGIKESALPAGSVVIHRQPTVWQLYRRYITIGIALFLAQTLVILALLRQRTERRRAEAELKRSEEKFSKAFRESPLGIAITRMSDYQILDVNETFEQQTGWSRDELVGRSPLDFGLWVDPDQRASFTEQLRAQGSVRDLEILTRGKSGETRTVLISAELIEVQGEQCALSVGADITERKQAEEALSTVSRKLIEAHEEERTWIARELHDDINQRLALLAVNLDVLNRDLPVSAMEAKHRTSEIKQQIKELGMDVQALSHRLHSSKLEYLGLSAAAGAFCREFSERKGVHVEFHSENIQKSLPEEISLCLFRVLQEALQNAAKHSGSQDYQVSLTYDSDELHLTVSDFGCGFNMEEALKSPGLGITSMRERLKIVDGELRIDSQTNRGTVVLARVPFHVNVRVASSARA